MIIDIKHFTVHQGFLYAMDKGGTTWRQPCLGNTGWVRLTKRITGQEPTDSKAYLSKQYGEEASATSEPSTFARVKKDAKAKKDEPLQADEGGA